MRKKNSRNWQKMGFRNYSEYKQFEKKADIKRIFEECLEEADYAHKASERDRQRQIQESDDRLHYHNLRIQELAKCQ